MTCSRINVSYVPPAIVVTDYTPPVVAGEVALRKRLCRRNALSLTTKGIGLTTTTASISTDSKHKEMTRRASYLRIGGRQKESAQKNQYLDRTHGGGRRGQGIVHSKFDPSIRNINLTEIP